MSDVLDELQDSPTPEGSDDSLEEDTQTIDVEALQKKAEEAEKKAERMYARAKKAEEKAKITKTTEEPTSPASFDIEDIVDLRVQGYSRDEISYAKTFAKDRGVSLSEAMNDQFVKAGIEGLRGKTSSEAATPAPTARTPQEPTAPSNPAQVTQQQWREALNKRKKQNSAQ